MGTTGFVGFVIDGIEKLSCQRSESYPAGLGVGVLHWLIEHRTTLDDARERARAVRVIDPNSEVSLDDVERYRAFASGWGPEADPHDLQDWSELLGDIQGDPDAILEAGAVLDATRDVLDSLSSEWGYLIDLDTDLFEVYRGYQKTPHAAGRFAGRAIPGAEYQPVALIASWPIADLPNQATFLKTAN